MTEARDLTEPPDQEKVPAESSQQAGVVADGPAQAIVSSEAPDRGWAAWSVVVGGWCAMFVSVGWNNAAGVFQTIYEKDFLQSYSPSAIGWIISLQTFFMFVSAPFTGKAFDSYGPRWIIAIGSFLQVLGVMMMSLSTQYWHFILAQSICTGIGGGAIFFAASNSIATWFKNNRALALGIASAGSATGGVIIPIMVNHIYDDIGFGWALRVVGFVFLGLLTITNVLLKSRLTHVVKKPHPKDFMEPLQEPPFLFLTAACFFFAMAVYQPGTFIALNAQREGIPDHISNYLLSILNASSVIGRVVVGWVADRAGRFNTMIITTFLSALFVLAAWIPAHSTAPFIVFAVLVGFTNGAYVALTSSLVAQISDIKKIGTRNGTNWFMYGIGALIGTPIAGALIQRDSGGYLYMQIFAGLSMFMSGCLFVGSRYVQIGLAWKWI
ncbi:MFS general substrate transporter [Paraphaeosphaeria sporulosa]|uniref:MFS general substrate transporter n=1 Tax=Paraphaeosphaeria sporulosa TaxID=1460663 RepID=A0A177CL22_9PLEO|nr:MFS general substrate transporter [Paraphaeosphaeria sporulosa]OAG07529.1 MFS general substrate transporter [Paraphaeosphaeria sporulosa]